MTIPASLRAVLPSTALERDLAMQCVLSAFAAGSFCQAARKTTPSDDQPSHHVSTTTQEVRTVCPATASNSCGQRPKDELTDTHLVVGAGLDAADATRPIELAEAAVAIDN